MREPPLAEQAYRQRPKYRPSLFPGPKLDGLVCAVWCFLTILSYSILAMRSNQRIFLEGMVSAITFGLMLLACPACRLRRPLICPANWALLAFGLQLVLLPFVVSWTGASQGTLPALPSEASIGKAIWLQVVGYVGFCLGYQWSSTRRRGTGRSNAPTSLSLIGWYLAVGSVGMLLRFPSIAALIAYFAGPQSTSVDIEGPASLAAAASLFLRPFLIVGIVLAWCRAIDLQASPSRSLRWASTALVMLLVTAVSATFSFNRASIVVPLASIAAVYGARVRPIRAGALVIGAMLCLPVILILGTYRTGGLEVSRFFSEAEYRGRTVEEMRIADQFQVYGMAPQFLGFMLQETEGRGIALDLPLASLMYPVPILGKSFRERAGVLVYNRAIYGNANIVDQIPPFHGELFIALGFPLLLAGFFALGSLMYRLQSTFESCQNAFGLYWRQYVGVWLMFLVQGSIESVSQVFVYFAWPIYIYGLWAYVRRSRHPRLARALIPRLSATHRFRKTE